MVALLVLLTIVTFILVDWICQMIKARASSEREPAPREAAAGVAAIDLRSETT